MDNILFGVVLTLVILFVMATIYLLYHPSFAPFTFTVTSLIPLNMDKDDKTCGVYFSVTKVE